MAESGASRSGAIAYFCVALAFALAAVGSFVWVMAAPSAADDQGTRATFAGWVFGVLALVLSAASAALGLRRRTPLGRDATQAGARDIYGPQQNISGQGTGNIGGIHFHGDAGKRDSS